MKKILLGIFLMLLSVWCLIFGSIENWTPVLFVGVYLPFVAIIVFLLGFFDKANK